MDLAKVKQKKQAVVNPKSPKSPKSPNSKLTKLSSSSSSSSSSSNKSSRPPPPPPPPPLPPKETKPVQNFTIDDDDNLSRTLILAFGNQISEHTANRLKETPLKVGKVSGLRAQFESNASTSAGNSNSCGNPGQTVLNEVMLPERDYDMPNDEEVYQNTSDAAHLVASARKQQPQSRNYYTQLNSSVTRQVSAAGAQAASIAEEQLAQMRLQLQQETVELFDAQATARQEEFTRLAQSIESLKRQKQQLLEHSKMAKQQQQDLQVQQLVNEAARLKVKVQPQNAVQQQQQLQLPPTMPSNITNLNVVKPMPRAESNAVNTQQQTATAKADNVADINEDLRKQFAELQKEVEILKSALMSQHQAAVVVSKEPQVQAQTQDQLQLLKQYAAQAPAPASAPTPACLQPQLQPVIPVQPQPIQTPLSDLIIADCVIDQVGSVKIYQLPLKQSRTVTGCTKYQVTAGKALVIPSYVTRTIIVVGATGAGKTTLINGMINFIFGVQWQHQYRLRLIAESAAQSQAHSQTQIISAYHIPQYRGSPVPYALTIVDTPGFGDTRGIAKDKEITEQMRKFFQSSDGVSEVNCVGFVTQASLPRLTTSQKYIFDSILATFGRDIVENITLLVTFADAQEPPVLAGVREAHIPFNNFNKFNNSALYVVPADAHTSMDFNAMFWALGEASFVEFFARLRGATTKSLLLTKQVLEQRRQLETVLNGILPQVQAALNQMEELRKQIDYLDRNRVEIEANANFTITIKVTKQKKIDLPAGVYVTNCLTCNATCHENCRFANDNDKYQCSAMEPQGDQNNAHCAVCAGKCFWTEHVNNPYKFELYLEDVVRTSNEMRDKYQSATQAKLNVEQLIKQMTLELQEIKKNLFKKILRARSCLRTLNEIAMKPNPLTMVDYLDQLIESELREMKPGFKDRLKALHDTKMEAEMLERIAKPGQTVDDVIANFLMTKK